MKLDALHVFLRVADYEHVTRAAEELALTQPAVSRTIQSLEQEAGLPLFEEANGTTMFAGNSLAYLTRSSLA